MNPLYHHFCTYIAACPNDDAAAVIRAVMKLTGGKADPNEISVWWNQWQALRGAMRNVGTYHD